MTVFVSLQAPGIIDPLRAHLAPGLLIGPDLVVVPTLPRGVLARHGTFEVLLAPAGAPAERLPVSHSLVYPADDPDRTADRPVLPDAGDGGAVALVVRLGRPTSLPAVAAPLQRPGSLLVTLRALLPDPDELGARLESTRTEAGIPYSPDRHPLSGLSPVPLAEALSGNHAVEEILDDPDICDWVPWC
jgi:hypothetical protein